MSNSENILALPIGTILHQYQIEAVLGQGGFGLVYKARHTLLDFPVAIKEYLPQMLATRSGHSVKPFGDQALEDFNECLHKFLDEAKQLIKFDGHPNVVKCRDFFEANGTAYVVMTFLDGEVLGGILRARQTQSLPLSERQILRVILPILSGLRDIHAVDVLHRDIKPDNIFIQRQNEQPVLIDFGAAKSNFSVGEKSSFVHTNGYAPLEQIDNHGNLGPWTDLYAVGAMMWRILANKNPPGAKLRWDALQSGTPDPMTSAFELGDGKYSNTFLKAIDRALLLNEADRFQSASEFIAALPSLEENPTADNEEPLTVAMPKAKIYTETGKASLPRISISPSIRVAPAQVQSAGVTSVAVNEPSTVFPSARVYVVGIVFLLCALLVIVIWKKSGNDDTHLGKPAQDVVASKIERMYEHANRKQNSLNISQGYLADLKALESIAAEAKKNGDDEDYQDTIQMMQRLKSKIQEIELTILHSETNVQNAAFELVRYRQQWESYCDEILETKIAESRESGNIGKANLLDGFYITIKRASQINDHQEINKFLQANLG